MSSDGQTLAQRSYLRAFGTVEVTDVRGAVILPIVSQPMRCAVLAYLTLESSTGYVSRDRLAAIFWPESDDERSRRSLNQLIYSLRQLLGSDVIEKRGDDQLAINRQLVRCDVLEFLDFLSANEPARALDTYQGDLLDGFYVGNAPEFERWVDEKRSDLRARAARAAWQVAEEHRSRGDVDAAGRYARRAASLTRHDEAAMQRLLQFLDSIGQRATAVQEYRDFEARMLADLDVEPSPETKAVIGAIRERDVPHERFTPAAFEIAGLAGGSGSGSENALRVTLSFPIVPRRRRARVAAFSVVAVAAVVAAIIAIRDPDEIPATGPTLNPRNIAVLYFDDLSPDASLGWLTRGLARDLIHDLSALDTLNVISAAGVQPFRNTDVTFDSVARALRVGTLVDGTVRFSNGRVEVTVQLIDATAGFQVRSERFEQPARELFKLQGEILFGINRFLRERIGHATVASQRRAGIDNVDAWRMVQQGEELLDEGIALGRYGSSVRAWASLGRADSLFVGAARLAPRWVEPVIMRARVARAQYLALTLVDPVAGQGPGSAGMVQMARTQIASGLGHVARALELEPGHPDASTLEGYFLFSRWFVDGQLASSDDLTAAESRLRAVAERQENQPLAWVLLSRIHRFRGDTLDADLAAHRAYAVDPFLYEGRRAIADLMEQHVERGRFTEARELCEVTRRTYQDDRELAECRLVILAWSASHRDSVATAWRELVSVEALGFPGLATSWTMRRMYVAAVAARSGLSDSALAIVARAYAARGVNRADSTRAAMAEAWIRLLTKSRNGALHVIDSLVSADGSQRERIATHPWFADLRADDRFARIVSESTSRR